MIRPLYRLLFVLLVAGFLGPGCVPGLAQAAGQAGRISGKVLDTEALPIPDATVQVVNEADKSVHEVKSDAEGAYVITGLPPGNYRVVVKATGFSVIPSDILTLKDGQSLAFDAKLTVQTSNTTVDVNSGGTRGVELDTATLSGTLSEKEVTSYGLNGRNVTQLITLTPGVSNQTGQDEAKVGLAGSAKYSVNGGRVEYNTFLVDGSDVLNSSINASRGQGLPLEVYPSVDAVQELQVLTSNYGAMYGKTASGSVLITTKSGTGSFHGNVYGFIRNEMFNARNYFDAPGRTPLYRRQDYGGTIGGPLYIPGWYNTKKDKTFFFFSEELRLEKTPVAYNQAVPTLAERKGDFRDVCGYLDPNITVGDTPPINVSKYPDCPLSSPGIGFPRLHANVGYTASALLNSNIIPLPNSAFGCNSTNTTPFNHCYVASVSPATYWREELFRIDHALTPKEQIAFRYVHDAWDTTTLTPQWGVVQNSFPTVENKLVGPGLNMVLSLAQTLPHTFINRIAFAYSVQHITLTPQPGVGVTSLARPGILDAACTSPPVVGPSPTPPGTSPGQLPQQLTECPMGYIFDNGFGGSKTPGLVFQGNNGAYGGHGFAADTGYAPWSMANPTYTLRDDATKAFGKHLLQFGVELVVAQQNELNAVNGANSGDLQGLLTFSNQQSKYTSGNAFADFLAGPGIAPLVPDPSGSGLQREAGSTNTAIKSFQQDSDQRKYYNRYKTAEFYLQDDWKITSRLTINVGVRASLFGTWYNAKGTAYNWEPQAYNQGLGASIYVDQTNGFLVRKTGLGSAGYLPAVPLDPNNLDPVITNGLVQCGKNGVPLGCATSHLFNPAPRIGLAWDPFGDGRTSVRAGYGLFWEHGTSFESNTGSLIGGAPLILSETQSFPSAGVQAGGIQPGAYNTIGFSCQQGVAQCGTTSFGRVTFPLNVTSIPTHATYPYVQQWSLSVQRELRKDLSGSLAYVGSKGTHLTAERDLNQLPVLRSAQNPFPAGQPLTANICNVGAQHGTFPVNGTSVDLGSGSSTGIGPNQPGYANAFIACTGNTGFKTGEGVPVGISADSLRPYTGFSNILSVENIATSAYSGLQGTLKETKGSLTVGVSYTYSHSIDDSSDRASANFADSLDIKSNRASSDFDQRHLLNISYIYDLPFRHFLNLFAHFVPEDDPTPPAGGAASTAGTTGAGQTPPAAASTPTAVSSATTWLDSPIWRTLLDGWQLSGITAFQTGSPFSVINAGSANGIGAADNAGVGNGFGIGSYVDIVGNPKGSRPVVGNSASNVGPLLYNPRAYVAPRALSFGNSGRNSLNNPSRTNFNAALLKHLKVLNERDLEFRAEVFNIFNHTQFRIYDPSHPGNTGNNIVNCYGDASSGYSAGDSSCLAGNSFLHPVDAHDPRIMQFGLKLAF
jgi:hypothetical protein